MDQNKLATFEGLVAAIGEIQNDLRGVRGRLRADQGALDTKLLGAITDLEAIRYACGHKAEPKSEK